LHLENIDYEILELVNQFDKVTEEKILEYFPHNSTVQYRIEELSRAEYDHTYTPMVREIPNSSYLLKIFTYENIKGDVISTYTGNIKITNLGKKTIEDYKQKQKYQNRKTWEERFFKFAPIVISVIALLKSYDII